MTMPPPTETSAPAQIKQESICAGGEPCKAPLRVGCPSAEQRFCLLELKPFFLFTFASTSQLALIRWHFSRDFHVSMSHLQSSEEVFPLQTVATVTLLYV